MRQLARYDEAQRARTLAAALEAEGIESRVEQGRDGRFVVWVYDERDMEAARSLLAHYEAHPEDPRFEQARRLAVARRLQREQSIASTPPRPRPSTPAMRVRVVTIRLGGLTLLLLGASIAVTLWSGFGKDGEVAARFLAASPELMARTGGHPSLLDVLGSEPWRLLLPMFLHFSPLHLFFNAWWLKDLGSIVESLESSGRLALVVVLSALVGHGLQLAWTGPAFGGLSGVVYGLLGYVGVRAKLDPASGYRLPRSIVVWMGLWLLLGFTPLLGRIANGAHLGGLLGGMLAGALGAVVARAERHRRG